jgi:hypothetical protein
MLKLFEASPDVKRDYELRKEVNKRLLNDFQHLLKTYGTSHANTEKEQEIISSINIEDKLSGMLHVLHNRLLDAIRRNANVEIKVVLNAINNYSYSSQDVRIICWYDESYNIGLHELYFDACDDSFRETYGIHFDGTTLRPKEKTHSKVNVELALKHFKEILPDSYDELNLLVSDVMIFHSPTMNVASSIGSLGIIRMSQLRGEQTWIKYFENIVCETAHQHLNNLFNIDPIILNEGKQLYDSPLEKGGMPLNSIYHALFVLARTIKAMETLKQSNQYNQDWGFLKTVNKASLEEKFNNCWDLIEQNAKLTEIGKKLMQSSREYAFD